MQVITMKCCQYWIHFSLALMSVPALAETFILKDGSIIEGTIVRSVGKTFSIKLDGRGMHQLPENAVDWVEIATTDGERVVGKLARWSGGVYLLLTAKGLFEVHNGVVREVVDDSQTAGSETRPVEAEAGNQVAPAASAASPLPEERRTRKLEPTM